MVVVGRKEVGEGQGIGRLGLVFFFRGESVTRNYFDGIRKRQREKPRRSFTGKEKVYWIWGSNRTAAREIGR